MTTQEITVAVKIEITDPKKLTAYTSGWLPKDTTPADRVIDLLAGFPHPIHPELNGVRFVSASPTQCFLVWEDDLTVAFRPVADRAAAVKWLTENIDDKERFSATFCEVFADGTTWAEHVNPEHIDWLDQCPDCGETDRRAEGTECSNCGHVFPVADERGEPVACMDCGWKGRHIHGPIQGARCPNCPTGGTIVRHTP